MENDYVDYEKYQTDYDCGVFSNDWDTP